MSAVSSEIRSIPGVTLAPGRAAGEPFVLREPLSFWGGLDSATGRIIDRWHPQHGAGIAGRILIMEAGRGSSSGSSVLAEAIRRGTGPAGIVLRTRDAIVTVGAMVAGELYGLACPVILAAAEDWPAIRAASHLTLEAAPEGAVIRCSGEPAAGSPSSIGPPSQVLQPAASVPSSGIGPPSQTPQPAAGSSSSIRPPS
ncbi:MAG TPA: DUF126 domain-containing protein [Microvirga sp.]|nr:DUF126 domain-containing protein [Microvirga sp.]